MCLCVCVCLHAQCRGDSIGGQCLSKVCSFFFNPQVRSIQFMKGQNLAFLCMFLLCIHCFQTNTNIQDSYGNVMCYCTTESITRTGLYHKHERKHTRSKGSNHIRRKHTSALQAHFIPRHAQSLNGVILFVLLVASSVAAEVWF